MPLSGLIFNHVFSFMSENSLRKKGVNHIEVNLSGLQSVDANLPKLMKSLESRNYRIYCGNFWLYA